MEINKFTLFLTTIYRNANQSTPDDFRDYAREVYSRIPKNFTEEDIFKCFKMGVYKELTNYTYLSAVTFDEWIKAYRANYKTKVNLTIDTAKQLEEKKKPTEEEIKREMKKWVIEVFDSYKNGIKKYYERGAVAIYEFLSKFDVIAIDDDEMDKIREKARLNVIAKEKIKQSKAKANDRLGDVNTSRNIIDSLINNLQNTSANSALALEIDRLCLAFWFDKLIEFDLDISDYLNF
jgi:hypothetical protein